MSRTLEQKRAQYSLEFIQGLRNDQVATGDMPEINATLRDKLNTLIQKAPVQIMQNGMGQLLAFLLADNGGKTGKHREPSKIFYDFLAGWLCGPTEPAYPCRIYSQGDLIKQLCDGDRRQYIRTQQEALALLTWTKKFAAAWLAG